MHPPENAIVLSVDEITSIQSASASPGFAFGKFAEMEQDISTLLKPDITTLLRHRILWSLTAVAA
jgi:hypothetical protein